MRLFHPLLVLLLAGGLVPLPAVAAKTPSQATETPTPAARTRPAPEKEAAALPATRTLSFFSVNTGEQLTATWLRDGEPDEAALAKIDHILRDRRNGKKTTMDRRLLDLLVRLRIALDTEAPFHVISAYRSPETNAARAATPGSGVADGSLHVRGMAIDIRVPGVPRERLRDVAVSLKAGGVGDYPKSDFVHVDVGRVRQW